MILVQFIRSGKSSEEKKVVMLHRYELEQETKDIKIEMLYQLTNVSRSLFCINIIYFFKISTSL